MQVVKQRMHRNDLGKQASQVSRHILATVCSLPIVHLFQRMCSVETPFGLKQPSKENPMEVKSVALFRTVLVSIEAPPFFGSPRKFGE